MDDKVFMDGWMDGWLMDNGLMMMDDDGLIMDDGWVVDDGLMHVFLYEYFYMERNIVQDFSLMSLPIWECLPKYFLLIFWKT